VVAASIVLAACGAKSGLTTDKSVPDAGASLDGATRDAAACGRACDDGILCNGLELCDPRTGECVPGAVPDCDDGDECTVDQCDPDRNACTHIAMDLDRDGDGATSCGGDCDDRDPTVFPGATELCDDVDNDCDDRIDEGVLSECRDCRRGCQLIEMPREVAWVPTDETAAGVELGPTGDLALSMTRTEFRFAWIANSEDGSITKLDTRTGAQAGEYHSALRTAANGARRPDEICVTSSAGGNCPSRTAVDLRGSVYVANRAFFNQGTVTKIAGFEEDCVDRNGDGTIQTSRDLDGDGRIERGVAGEFLGQADECLVWTVPVGDRDGLPRAIAVAADGTLWVGLHNESTVLQLDPADGRVLRTVALGRFAPYGAAIDGRERLWLTEAGTGRIVSVNTTTGAVGARTTATSRAGCSGSYGIAVDARDRVWLAGFQCPVAFRYDPASGIWFTVELPNSGAGRGIAADDRGFVYMAASHEWITIGPGGLAAGPEIARVSRFRADDGGELRIFGSLASPLPGLGSTGVGLDPDRNLWLINQVSGTATRVDPVTGVGREFVVGDGPYTYSDFTGFALRTFTAPNGYLRTVVEGCAVGPTEWERLTWTATEPARTRVFLRVRTAATPLALGSATWIGPFESSPVDFAMPPGPLPTDRYLEVEVNLVSDDETRSPRVQDVTVQLHCPI
jgi:hypothetical protein